MSASTASMSGLVVSAHAWRFDSLRSPAKALMFLTSPAVLLATSLAAWTKCFLATGLLVLLLATLQALHRTLVCLAITVAAAKTCLVGGGHNHLQYMCIQDHNYRLSLLTKC